MKATVVISHHCAFVLPAPFGVVPSMKHARQIYIYIYIFLKK